MSKRSFNYRRWVLIFLLLLWLVGIFFIGDVSLAEARLHFQDSFYFVKKQLLWSFAGLMGLLLAAKLPFSFWRKIAFAVYLLSLVFLGLVLVPGIGRQIWGAHRWLVAGPFVFQPAEFSKFAILLYLSCLLIDPAKRRPAIFLLISAPSILLVALEPDLGTSIIIAMISMAIYFISGASVRSIIALFLIAVILGSAFIAVSPYRRQRIMAFTNPFYDPLDRSYHAYQLVLTLHQGGWLGKGLGESRQKYRSLPQVTTDSILAIIGEETGFVGLVSLLAILGGLAILILAASAHRGSILARHFGAGLAAWVGGQGFLNASAIAVLLPFTGVPFPLISYGGSALVMLLLAFGLFFSLLKE